VHLKINPSMGARLCTQPDTQSTIAWLERNWSPSGLTHANVSSADHPFRQPWKIEAMAPDNNRRVASCTSGE